MDDLRVAVVIVNTNDREHLPRALESLAAQTLPPRRTIVVDNASTDGSVELVKEQFRAVELLPLPANVGFAAANNTAVRAAEGCEWVALLNPDAFAEPGWLEALVAAARRSPGAFFASQMRSARDPEWLDGTGDAYHVGGFGWRRDHGTLASDSRTVAYRSEVFSACGGAALYPRDAFLAVGGFDEDYFGYYEDLDLAFRLRLAGHRCYYVPEAVVHHVGSATTGVASDYSVYHGHRNLVWTYVKNMPWPLVLLYLPQHLLVNVLGTAMVALRGQAGPVLAAKRDALRGLPGALAKRSRIQSARRVSASDVKRAMERGVSGYGAVPGARRFLSRLGRPRIGSRGASL